MIDPPVHKPRYKAEQRVKFPVTRSDTHFDRACETASEYACYNLFYADEDGYCQNVIDSDRGTDSIHVKFISWEASFGMGGPSHVYTFEAWVSRHIDEDEDD